MTTKMDNILELERTQQVHGSGQGHMKMAALRCYQDHGKRPISDDQIVEFLPMVRKIAQKVAQYINPPLSLEDLISAGTVGLIKAANDFDCSQKTQFKTYAYIRIKGAVLDELRKNSLLPAQMGRQVKKAMEISRRFILQNGSVPSDEQMAQEMDISIDQVRQIFESARVQHFISYDSLVGEGPSLEGTLPASNQMRPDYGIEKAELLERLTEAIGRLDEKRRRVVVLYYQQNLTMKEIAAVLGISESRVCQLHARAVFDLSSFLGEWSDGSL